MENTQKEIFTSTMPDEVKGTVFRENRIGDHKLAYDEQNKKSLKKLPISTNFGPKQNFFTYS
jgi:hypothetical protein